MNEHQRAAYLEILTWMARMRDQVRRAILEDRPLAIAFSEPYEQARLDALLQMYGSRAVRSVAAEWPVAFSRLMFTLARWNAMRDEVGSPRDAEAGSVRSQLEKDHARLVDVIDRMQEQIRREVQVADLPPATRGTWGASTLRVTGVLMIAAAGLMGAPPAWRSWWPTVRAATMAHQTGVALGLLIAGLLVVIIAGGVSARRGGDPEAG